MLSLKLIAINKISRDFSLRPVMICSLKVISFSDNASLFVYTSTRPCFRLTNSCSLYEAKLANIIFSAVIRETMLLLQDGLHLDLLQWMRSPLKQPIRTKHRFFLSSLPPKQSEDAGEQAARGFVLFQSSYIFYFLFSFGERCEDASSFPEECFN